MSSSPLHIILVPGFAGFDALGGLEYYVGVTPIFEAWAAARDTRIVLRYFDNLPTAGVETRAKKLARYFGTRFARREIQIGDRVALVGHSTGGLDIRQMLADCATSPDRIVEGTESLKQPLTMSMLAELVRRIVFLSVPQRGTNVADWVFHHRVERTGLVEATRQMMALGRVRPIEQLERKIVDMRFDRTGLGQALRDVVHDCSTEALDEGGKRGAPREAYALSRALETEADVALYLRQIDFDFGAISDLCVVNPYPDETRSPAHFDDGERADELEFWADKGIQTRSFATVGRLPYREPPKDKLTMLHLLFNREPARSADGESCDLPYRLAYRATARGAFEGTGPGITLGTHEPRTLQSWENDGIVNTASMLWPNGPDTIIVDGDHGDIIGHFHHQTAPQRTYDLLGSASGFDAPTFEAVWKQVFDFAGETND